MSKTRDQINSEKERLINRVEDRENFPSLDEKLREEIVGEINAEDFIRAYGLALQANESTLADILKPEDINPGGHDLERRLADAVQRGETAIVAALLNLGVNPNITDKATPTIRIIEYPILIIAAAKGYTDIVELLIKAGANVNAINPDEYYTALIFAAQKSYPRIVNLLLEAGADVDFADINGKTPLMRAAEAGCIENVNLLLAAGAEVNEADNQGNTALIFAAKKGHQQITDLLLQAGAKVNAVSIKEGMSLELAIGRSPEITGLILQYKPDLTLLTEENFKRELSRNDRRFAREATNLLMAYCFSLPNLRGVHRLMRLGVNNFLSTELAEVTAAVLPDNDLMRDKIISKHRLYYQKSKERVSELRELNNKFITQSVLRGDENPEVTARVITFAYALEREMAALTSAGETSPNCYQLSVEQRSLLSEVLEAGKEEGASEEKQNPPSHSPRRATIARLVQELQEERTSI